MGKHPMIIKGEVTRMPVTCSTRYVAPAVALIAGSPDFPHKGLINGKTFNLRNPLRK